MDGLLFYWLAWIFWIFITFIMPKNRLRSGLALGLLVVISFSNTFVLIAGIQMNAVLTILYIGSILILARKSNWLSNIFCCLCVLFGYVGLLFWEQISPVWIFTPKVIMIPIIGFVLMIILVKTYFQRCFIWCLGITAGEIVHGLILFSYGFEKQIGDMAFLDILFVELALLSGFEVFKIIKLKIDDVIGQIEKQKKRWTT